MFRHALSSIRASLASVRVRAVVLATIVVGLGLVFAAVGLVTLQRHTLRENVDDAVRLRAADLALLTGAGELPAVLAVTDPEIALVQVLDGDGNVLASTSNIAGMPPLFDVPPSTEPVFFDVTGLPIDDEAFRVLVIDIESPAGPRRLYVAASLEPVAESTESLVEALRLGMPVMLAVVAAGTWVVVSRALRPIESIRRAVEEISLARLDQRVPEPGTRDEVARLASTMNDLLARLDAAHVREEQFIADAAHELRSPLASLRTQLEVHARGGAPLEPGAAEALAAEVSRLQALAENLLLLSAFGNGVTPGSTLIDLDDIVLEEVRAAAVPPGKRVESTGVSGAAVRGDPEALRRLVRNLLDNALRHATSVVTVSLREDAAGARLTVADDGAGIAPADRERVFERFVRLDPSRGAGGAGLGLAICRAVAEAHGGTIAIDEAHEGGVSLSVHLPPPG